MRRDILDVSAPANWMPTNRDHDEIEALKSRRDVIDVRSEGRRAAEAHIADSAPFDWYGVKIPIDRAIIFCADISGNSSTRG